MKIEDLINSIGASVTQAYNEIENSSVSSYLNNYFNISNDVTGDTYSPRIIRIEMPAASAEANEPPRVIDVPIAALVSSSSLNLDSVKVNINIDAKEDNGALQVNPIGANTQNDSSPSQGGNIELTFKCSQGAEGIARIETQLNKML